MKPVRLAPTFHETIWGSTELEPWFPRSDKKIGEAWFTAEPLLVKFLYTTQPLSVQVHPEDAGERRGKTEMWHILRAGRGARIALGFRRPISRAFLKEAARSGEIVDLLRWIPVAPGETYFTPARTVHAIGPGVALCEIQQNSNVTYRLFDWGRGRPLHLRQAAPIARLGRHPGRSIPVPLSEHRAELVRCPYFVTESVMVAEETAYVPESEHFDLWISLEGRGRIGEEPFQPGEVWQVPVGSSLLLRPEEPSRFLRTYVPRRD